MDKVYLRSQLLAKKDFIKRIYKGNSRQNRRIISAAEEKNLNILIKILHLVCNGIIKIRKDHFAIILKSRRFSILKKNFEKKNSYVESVHLNLPEKRKLLQKFAALYSNILYFLFNLD